MTFYQELKEFFKKNDPQRLYMAKAIAAKFKLGSEQKVVLNRLKVVYDTGGPANIVLGDPNADESAIENEVVETIENVDEETIEIHSTNVEIEIDIDIEGESQDIIIETPDDEEKDA